MEIENTESIEKEKETMKDSIPPEKQIRHIVLSGGGVAGFSFYGVLKESHLQGFWNMNHIQTIYGTSAGSIFGAILCLGYDWDILDDYLIKRPWHNVYKFNLNTLFSTFQTKGIFDHKVIQETFSPLFKAKDLSLDITLKELYDWSHIEIHVFAIDLNTMESIDFSWRTHPDWKLVDAVYCSCSLPVLFQPMIDKNMCFCDGGIIHNYPVKQCIDNGADPDEIFGISRKTSTECPSIIQEESTLLDYLLFFLNKTVKKLSVKHQIVLKNEISIASPSISISDIFNTTSSMEERIRLIQLGVDAFIESGLHFTNT